MAEKNDEHKNQNENNNNTSSSSSFIIKIPSYQEVIESSNITSQSKTTTSLFKPSPSFSQAFNFIKNSDFYSPPPPPPSSASTQSTDSTPSSSRGINYPEASSSASVASSTASFKRNANNRNAILVSHRQKGNPLLKHIRNVRWEFADVICDYLLGQNACALYLSIRYHLLHPDYLYFRIRELQKNFKFRVVLCHVDVEDVVKPLLEITKTALLHECTLLCAWSLEECGRYLETIKVYENKPADIIQGQMDTDYLSRLTHALTTVRHVNKTDVVTLGSTFGSLSHVMDASMEDLARCPGIGERKVKRLYDTFHEPFKRVISNQTAVLEAPVQLCPASEGKEVDKEVEDTTKGKKKGPEITVKSALKEALAKYSGKVAANNEPVQDMNEAIAADKNSVEDHSN